MRRRWLQRLGIVLLLAGGSVLATCKSRSQVRLTFGSDRSAFPRGWVCTHESGAALYVRAYDSTRDELQTNLVVDFVRLGPGIPNLPFCLAGLGQWCLSPDHVCEPIEGLRRCYEVPPIPVGMDGVTPAEFWASMDALSGVVVSPDAPNDPVIVRAVATTQPCSEVLSVRVPLEPCLLVGCALSCPVLLDTIEGDLPVTVPSIDGTCEEAFVQLCASDWDQEFPAVACPPP